jgi:(p)ppGpp synthase/HD superfamily hydrolase
MPTAERYAKMTEKQKEAERERGKQYYYANLERSKDIAHRSYIKHQKERLEAAHFQYIDNPQKEIERTMKYYRKKNSIIHHIRERKNGELWAPKVCLNCKKLFIPNSKKQIYCTQKCFAENKGYKNLPQHNKIKD